MNKIEVIVNYVRPTEDKFNALMEQYNEIKQLSNETVSYYKPLAEMAEEAKFNAIMSQLETIKSYMKKLYAINKNNREIYTVGYGTETSGNKYFRMKVCSTGEIDIYWNEYPFTLKQFKANPHVFNGQWYDDWNIIGNWDKWHIYETLERRCINMLNAEIEQQKKKAIEQVERLKNITGEQ